MTDTSTKAVEALKDRVATLTAHGATWVSAEDYIALLAEREALRERCRVIEEYDDGTTISLSSYAGGAAQGGVWSSLTLMRESTIDGVEFRDFKATGDWKAGPVPATAAKGEGA